MNYSNFTNEELQNAMRITQIELREAMSGMDSLIRKRNEDFGHYDRIIQSCMKSADEMCAEVMRRCRAITVP